MKKVYHSILLAALIFSLQNSKVFVAEVPKKSRGKSASAPGQIKKTTRSQSANPYAPVRKKKINDIVFSAKDCLTFGLSDVSNAFEMLIIRSRSPL